MPKKLIVIDAHRNKSDKTKTNVWWKIDRHFINQENIRALSRKGKYSVIRLFYGEDVTVNVNYDKLSVLLPHHGKI